MDRCDFFGVPMTVHVPLTVAPEACAGCVRTYPVGTPTLTPVTSAFGVPFKACAAQYIIRQAFVAEIPVTLHAGACVHKPCVMLKRGPCLTRRLKPR